jgi:hypothetical protein
VASGHARYGQNYRDRSDATISETEETGTIDTNVGTVSVPEVGDPQGSDPLSGMRSGHIKRRTVNALAEIELDPTGEFLCLV